METLGRVDYLTGPDPALDARRPLRVTAEPAFRRFWYPVAQSDVLGATPLACRLLGVEVVLWRPGSGSVAGAVDRCPHRDARLSGGWLGGCGLVCPYHGWEYGASGRAVRIPQLDEGAAIPPGAQLQMVGVAERLGWVWVCLEPDPALPLPIVAEYDDPAWRAIHEPDSEWHCPAPLLIENNLDPAHIAYVHRDSFGSPATPKVPVADVHRTANGLRSAYQVGVQSRPGESGATVRTTTSDLYGPFLELIRIRYPDGVVHLMVKACTPVDDVTVRQLQLVLRTDTEQQRPAADIVAFDAGVWLEDKAILEDAHHDFFLNLTANVHLRFDRPSIEYRRMLADIVDGRFPATDQS